MPRTHILARELRGTLLVLFVALLIVWLFTKLSDDRAEAQDRISLARTTTSAPETTTTTTTIDVDDNQRLCSLASAFRNDLSSLEVQLVSPSGSSVSFANGAPIDIGMPSKRDEDDVSEDLVAVPPPAVVDPDRINPFASGLLGEPQVLAFNFYTAASTLRLGPISADLDATADYFSDFVQIGEPAMWDLAALEESDLNDRWVALTTQPLVGVNATLLYIEEECGTRIGRGFVYREEPPELPILDPILVPIDPLVDPNRPSPNPPPPNPPPPSDDADDDVDET